MTEKVGLKGGIMHICLNMLGDSGWIGGALYIQNLARAIASLPKEEKDQIKLSVGVYSSNLELAEPMRPYVDQIYARNVFDRRYLKICKGLAERFSFIPLQMLNPQKVDFVYPELAGARAPYRWGAWIPDFQHYHLPHLFSPEEIADRDIKHKKMAEVAPVVILSSQMAQNDFKHLYPDAASRSAVMTFASFLEPEWLQGDPKQIQAKYELPDQFFLVSNQFWKHKDHTVIIEALGLLKQQGIKPIVACTGSLQDRRNPEYSNQLLARIKELDLNDQFRTLGLIPRIDQIQLMRRSLAVIQPSLFEGWSTVVEDSRTLGKPMLISDFPVHIEQNPPYSHFFERGNAEQLADLISLAWSTFKPGPDLDRENIAKQENKERVAAYGRRFLEIVRSAL
ncbi:MAG: glycosyltransferase [Microcoleus vaginatus WJT46-NPBG5]|nr:glycosyltransferase [Microcoleus vaginatus WJT46-NPBG5]